MYARPTPSVARRLERHASTILISGLILCCGGAFFISMCTPASQNTRATFHEGHYPANRRNSTAKKASPDPLTFQADLVVAVLTGPRNFERRDTLRETWLSSLPVKTKKYFVIGTSGLSVEEKASLDYEQSVHKDLLILPDLKDSYYALTDKVIELFTWLSKNVDYRYLLKVDDDSFVRLDIIAEELRSGQMPKDKLYWGFFDGRARVKRRGQWAESKWILCDRYTPHALGGGYVLSKDLVDFIVLNRALLQRFNSEDVSVGVWLGGLDINRKHDPRFDTEWESRGCNDKYVITHKQDVAAMKQKHINLRTTGRLCKTQVQKKLSYIYNWNTDPTSCCIRNDSRIP